MVRIINLIIEAIGATDTFLFLTPKPSIVVGSCFYEELEGGETENIEQSEGD
jgi:hypothetical protein